MRYGVLIYDGVEPIDLGATFGVLSMARRLDPAIEAVGVARSADTVHCASGLRVLPDFDFGDFPGCDALIVTGGPGWTQAAADAETLAFLKALPETTRLAAICTGAMILAAAGLLDGRVATTKVEVTGAEQPPIQLLKQRHPQVQVQSAVAALSEGVLTSGGVSLGIDGVFYLLQSLHGEVVVRETARIMEYQRALAANAAAMPPIGLPPLPA